MNWLKLIKKIIQLASPDARRMLKNSILAFAKAAEETPSLWDDVLAALLKALLIGEQDGDETE